MERSRGKEWLVKLVHASAARSGLVNDWPSVTAGSGGTERYGAAVPRQTLSL